MTKQVSWEKVEWMIQEKFTVAGIYTAMPESGLRVIRFLVERGECTAYDIKELAYNQAHTTLKHLEKFGMVVARRETGRNSKLDKVYYSLSLRGLFLALQISRSPMPRMPLDDESFIHYLRKLKDNYGKVLPMSFSLINIDLLMPNEHERLTLVEMIPMLFGISARYVDEIQRGNFKNALETDVSLFYDVLESYFGHISMVTEGKEIVADTVDLLKVRNPEKYNEKKKMFDKMFDKGIDITNALEPLKSNPEVIRWLKHRIEFVERDKEYLKQWLQELS